MMAPQPRWTHHRVRWALAIVYGTNRRGGVDTAAVAARLGVSQRTVQRWLAGGPRSTVPPSYLARISTALLPSEVALRHEEQEAVYAREAIAQLALGRGRGVLPAWSQQRWVEPHAVLVLAPHLPQVLQVAFCRDDQRPIYEMRRRGDVLDSVVVANRFHAIVVVHALLEQVRQWRIGAGVPLPTGVTRAFAAFADRPTLHTVADGDPLVHLTAARYPLPTAPAPAAGTP